MPAEGSITLSVRPVTGLSKGEHNTVISIQGGDEILNLTVKFTVSEATYSIGTVKELYDFGTAPVGYGETQQPAAQTVTIKNTGNQTITLKEPKDYNAGIIDRWEIGELSKTTLAPNETATFSLRPKLGHKGTGGGGYNRNSADYNSDSIYVKTENDLTYCYVRTRFVVGLIGELDASILDDYDPVNSSYGYILLGDTKINIAENDNVSIHGICSAGDCPGTLTITGSDKGILTSRNAIWFNGSSINIQGGHIVSDAITCNTTDSITVLGGVLDIDSNDGGFDTFKAGEINISGGTVNVRSGAYARNGIWTSSLNVSGGVLNVTKDNNDTNGAINAYSINISGDAMVNVVRTGAAEADTKAIYASYLKMSGNAILRAEASERALTVNSKSDLGTTHEVVFPAGGYAEYGGIFDEDGNHAAKVCIYPTGEGRELTAQTYSGNFGSVEFGSARPDARTFEVKNTGAVPLWISLSESENFDIGDLSKGVLKPDETATFTVQPKADLEAGNYTDTISVLTDLSDVKAVYSVTYTVSPITASVEIKGNSSLDFGKVAVEYESAPAAQSITLHNNGEGTVNFVLPSSEYYDFEFVPNSLELKADASTTLNIRPKAGLAIGKYDVPNLYLRTNRGAYVIISLAFEVEEVRYELSFEKEGYDFGTARIGYNESELPAAQIVKVTNTGNMALTLKEPGVYNASDIIKRWEIGSLSKTSLAPGESASFSLRPKTGHKGTPCGGYNKESGLYSTDFIYVKANENNCSGYTCTTFVVGLKGNVNASSLKEYDPGSGYGYVLLGDTTITLASTDDVSITGIGSAEDLPGTLTIKGSDAGVLKISKPLWFQGSDHNITIEHGHVIADAVLATGGVIEITGGTLDIDSKDGGFTTFNASTLNIKGGVVNVRSGAYSRCGIKAYYFNISGGILNAEKYDSSLNEPTISAESLIISGNAVVNVIRTGADASKAIYATTLEISENATLRAEAVERAIYATTDIGTSHKIVMPSGGVVDNDNMTIIDTDSNAAKLVLIQPAELEANAKIDVAPASMDFEFATDAEPTSKKVTVTNAGNVFVGLKPVSSTFFEIGDYSKKILAPGDSAYFTVTPKSTLLAGKYPEVIDILTDTDASAKLDLTANVLAADYSFVVSPGVDLDLGEVLPEEEFEGKTLTVKNVGNRTLSFIAFNLVGSYSDSFVIDRPDSPKLEPGQSFEIAVTAKSLDHACAYNAQLIIATDHTSVSVSLKAAVIDPPEGIWVKDIPDQTYNGKAIKINPFVYFGSNRLSSNDYTVTYKNNTNAALSNAVNSKGASIAPTVIVKGKGNYSGTIEKTFNILPANIDLAFTAQDAEVNSGIAKAHQTLLSNGSLQKGSFTLKYLQAGKEITLKNNKDYSLFYPHTDPSVTDPLSENVYDPQAFKMPGIYSITVMGIGNYTGSRTLKLEIADKENVTLLSKVKISDIPNQVYSGKDFILAGEPDSNETRVIDKNGKVVDLVLTDKAKNTKLVYGTDYDISYTCNREIGTAKVTLTGKGKYAGTVNKQFKITGVALSSLKQSDFAGSIKYTGYEITQPMRFYYTTGKGKSAVKNYLTEGEDYTIEYVGYPSGIVEAGSYTVLYTGLGKYTGTVKKTMKITGIEMSKVSVTDLSETTAYTYNSKAKGFVYTGICFEVAGSSSGYNNNGIVLTYKASRNSTPITLSKGYDYTVSYENNVEPGTATVIFKGLGEYSGSLKKTFKIVPFSIEGDQTRFVVYDPDSSEIWEKDMYPDIYYTKGTTCPVPKIRDTVEGEDLVLGRDYTLSWKNNKNVKATITASGNPTLTIAGKGRYSGKITRFFTIRGGHFSGADAVATDVVWQNKGGIVKNTSVTITESNGKKLKSGTDYYKPDDPVHPFIYIYDEDTMVKLADGTETLALKESKVSSDQIIPVGTRIRVHITGKGNYDGCDIAARFHIVAADLKKASVSVASKPYTGSEVRLSETDLTVTVKVDGKDKTLVRDTDYVVDESTYKNNVSKGNASVVIRGKGENGFGGTKTVTFKIVARQLNYSLSFDSSFEKLVEALYVKDPSHDLQWYKDNYRISGSMKTASVPVKGKITKNAFKVQKKSGSKWAAVPSSSIAFKGWNTSADGTGHAFADNAPFIPSWLDRLIYGSEWKLYAQWEVE